MARTLPRHAAAPIDPLAGVEHVGRDLSRRCWRERSPCRRSPTRRSTLRQPEHRRRSDHRTQLRHPPRVARRRAIGRTSRSSTRSAMEAFATLDRVGYRRHLRAERRPIRTTGFGQAMKAVARDRSPTASAQGLLGADRRLRHAFGAGQRGRRRLREPDGDGQRRPALRSTTTCRTRDCSTTR